MENIKNTPNFNTYESNYCKSFSDLIENSVFTVNDIDSTKEEFFDNLLKKTHKIKNNNSKIFFVGNGASAAFANHMALDWSKNGLIKSYSLSDSALLTALSNDLSYEDAFTKYLEMYEFNSNDLVVTISSSGNSKNIVNVIKYCNEKKIKTVGFSGLNNNNLTKNLSDFSIYVPCKTYGFAECIHQFFLHLWLDKYMEIYEWDRTDSQNMDYDNFLI